MIKFTFLPLILLLCGAIESSEHKAILKSEFIFDKAHFSTCHASTLTETSSEKILVAWFAGTQEGAEDVNIWGSVLENNAWSAPRIFAAETKIPLWNPVLFCLPNHEILLFYKVGRNPKEWSGCLKRSFNEGKNWSQTEPLPAGIIGPVKNKPLLLKDNTTLLCGSSIESWRRWGCYVDITKDFGRTWQKSPPINVERQYFGIIQPTLFWGKKGEIKMLCRSNQLGFVATASSYDNGKTWTNAKPTSLNNPNSAIDAVNLKDGRVLVIYNDSKEDRYPLTVGISEDGGESWHNILNLEETPGEYSYPSIIQAKNGLIHITYTWNRMRIKYAVLDPELLR